MSESDFYTRGRAAWPEIVVAATEFAAGVARASARTDPGEIYLACACASGDAGAIRAFEARYFACVPTVARRLRLSDDDAQEIAQTLRQRMFVGGVPEAAVLAYAGGGRLGGLIQVAATRIGLNLNRGRERLAGGPVPEMAVAGHDVSYARSVERAHVKRAIECAAAALPARDRTLLRLHFVDRAGIDDIAAMYRVHRATAARWLAAARAALAANTRGHLAGFDADAGLASFVESQLTLSLPRILA